MTVRPSTENTTPKMNVRVKRQWVEALRSGKYRQGQYFLHSSADTYCCLGVLGVVLKKSDKKMLDNKSSLTPKGWKVIPEHVVDCLVEMNDSMDGGKSFAEIADYIESNL